MSLIKCTECKKDISDKEKACIHCGCPIQIKSTDITEHAETTDLKNEVTNKELQEIMEQTGYSRIKTIEILTQKTGLSRSECKILLDKNYTENIKPYTIPKSKTSSITISKDSCTKACVSCRGIFPSSDSIQVVVRKNHGCYIFYTHSVRG